MNTILRARWCAGYLAIAAALMAGCSAEAPADENQNQAGPAEEDEAWPDGPITIVIPHDVGGSADRLSRGLATFLSESLGQQVRVENRPGGGGSEGITYVLNHPDAAEGNLLVSTSTDSAAEALLALDTPDDLSMVAVVNDAPSLVVTNSASEVQTFDDLVAQMEELGENFRMGVNPGGLEAAELLRDEVGIPFRIVNYDGGGSQLSAALGNADHAYLGGAATIWPNVEAGQLRALVVTSEERLELTGDVPSWPEAVGSRGWSLNPLMRSVKGLFGSTAFVTEHPDRVQTLVDSVQETMDDPAGFTTFMEETSADGPFMRFTGHEDADDYLRQSIDVYRAG